MIIEVYWWAGLVVGLVGWLGWLTFIMLKEQRLMRQLTAGITKKDLQTLLRNIAESLKTVSGELNHIEGTIKDLQKEDRKHFQKSALVRFNPFTDTGGDQSFSLCLLNRENDGLIITSLHSREQTRIYAKKVSRGEVGGYTLAKEEVQALNQALKA